MASSVHIPSISYIAYVILAHNALTKFNVCGSTSGWEFLMICFFISLDFNICYNDLLKINYKYPKNIYLLEPHFDSIVDLKLPSVL